METTITAADVQKLAQPDAPYGVLYAELKKRAKAAKLMDRQPVYYTLRVIESLAMQAISVAIILLSDNFLVQLSSAALMALTWVRFGFMMHDAGHRQIFKKPRQNDLIGLVFSNLLLGSSISSWRVRHNEHHAHTNELGLDPTLEIPLWAWIEEQAREQKGIVQWLMKYQAWTFVPVLSLSGFFQLFSAVRDVFWGKRVQDRGLQGLFLIVHHVLYFWLLASVMNWWQVLVFFVVHHLITGLHLGLTFAPNHKGMPIVEPDHGMDYLYVQTLTTRNVRPGPVIDYMYGALNYQIEHHLFPGMPRNKLGEARTIVKAFCEEHDLPYYETGVIESYREILAYMHEVGGTLREESKAARRTKVSAES